MKIWSFTTVKDEEDIIEGFVRYHATFLDGMVISDNCSNDSTLEILRKLKAEGLPIDILEDANSYFEEAKKRSELLQYTMQHYQPDFVFPLDADEFISTKDGINPRDVIATFSKDTPISYLMRNYVYTGDVMQELFVPKRLTQAVMTHEGAGHNYKCIIPDKIYDKGIILATGSHFVATTDGKPWPSMLCENLFLAHYPIRSKLQLMNKVITGRLNHSSLYSRELQMGYHQYEILDEIIRTGTLSEEFLFSYSCYYSIKDKSQQIELQDLPMPTKFCGDIVLKYTTFSDEKVLINTLKTSFTVIERLRVAKETGEKGKGELHNQYNELLNQHKVLHEQYSCLQEQHNHLHEQFDLLLDQHKQLEISYNLIANSKFWRLKGKLDHLLGRTK